MKRNVDLKEISDGRLYHENDMVKADCHGCSGCHRCCTGMGTSVILDPYDVHRLWIGTGNSFQQLLEMEALELQVVDGCILPNLKMVGRDESCFFLNAEGRCSIHPYRPGVCRLFPLGRYYENRNFKYFLQTRECVEKNRSKVKISKWLDTPSLSEYHEYLCLWHSLLKDIEKKIAGQEAGERSKKINMMLLQMFYITDYEVTDFYRDSKMRMNAFRTQFGIGMEE